MTVNEARSEPVAIGAWSSIGLVKAIGQFFGRMGRAVLLESDLYKEVARDRASLVQAFGVVVLVAFATALNTSDDGLVSGVSGLPVNIVLGFVGWVVWASVTYLLGQAFLRTEGNNVRWGELARAVAFAQVPLLLRAFGLLPNLGIAIALVALVWVFVSMTIATRAVYGTSTSWKPAAVVMAGFVPYLFIVGGLTLLVNNTTS